MKKIYKLSVFILILIILSGSIILSSEDSIEEVLKEQEEEIENLIEREQEIFNRLFMITQNIDELVLRKNALNEEIKVLEDEIIILEKSIDESNSEYEKNKLILEKILLSQQRNGPANYLEIIFSSRDFSDFIRRLNILKDIGKSKNRVLDDINKLSEELEFSKLELSNKKNRLEDSLKSLEEENKELELSKLELEKELDSLGEKRESFESELLKVQEDWEKVADEFEYAINDFSRIIKYEQLPIRDVDISIGLRGVKVGINQKVFNDLIEEYSEVEGFHFTFQDGKMVVSLEELDFIISGDLDIKGETKLIFLPEEGSFKGLSLTEGSIEELFSSIDLIIELEPILEGGSLTDVKILEEKLEIMSRISIFGN